METQGTKLNPFPLGSVWQTFGLKAKISFKSSTTNKPTNKLCHFLKELSPLHVDLFFSHFRLDVCVCILCSLGTFYMAKLIPVWCCCHQWTINLLSLILVSIDSRSKGFKTKWLPSNSFILLWVLLSCL